MGGEYGSSATYLSEMAGRDRRGFWSSFQYVTIIGGQLTALALLVVLQAVLGDDALRAWGWRIGFFAGALLAVVALILRRQLDETLSYTNAQAKADRRRSTVGNLLRDHPREFFLVMALTAGGTASFYAYTIYLQKFLANTSGFPVATASLIMTVALAIMLVLQPFAGRLSDKIGRRPMMIFFGTGAMLFTYPLFTALEGTRDALTAFALCMAALVIVTGYTSINAVIKAEMFPADIARARRRFAVRARQCGVRGKRRICRALSQEYRARALVLYLHQRARRDEPDRLRAHARNAGPQPDRRGLKPGRVGSQPAEGLMGGGDAFRRPNSRRREAALNRTISRVARGASACG